MSANKIFLDPDTLAPHIEELKARGLMVVFANGCFELLHVGHVRYLEAAKALGDVLLVAVNSDESMARIKPDRRPVIPDVERYELLAAFEMVDYVVPLVDMTPEALLRKFRPQIHTKGTDYTLTQIPERAVVEAYGGQVRLVGDPKNHSTTEMLRALRGRG
ncbi:MAG: adenylyltransferase/cytidyltransferase family protein [Planctomycetes bacterium]|nr:adenylyltransferase/cytidyltransferase family protein [Planctomycetota bacterium]